MFQHIKFDNMSFENHFLKEYGVYCYGDVIGCWTKSKAFTCILYLQTLKERADTLEAVLDPLTVKEESLRDNLPGKDELVERAWAHANNLSKYAEDLEK